MRKGILFFVIICISLLLIALHSISSLLGLLFYDGRFDAILREELQQYGTRQQLIPRIIHQTYKNSSIPPVWQHAQASCLNLHPDWQYLFWTDKSSEAFIADEYSWFLDTFKAYKYDIQRADAIRYFVLAHYGGIYIDMDDGCNRALDPMLTFPAFVRKTTPTGISNDVMGATPHHPFFGRVLQELQRHDRSWVLPYVTVMGSTGPLFLSLIWEHWTAEGQNSDLGRVRILEEDAYMGTAWSFFTHHKGNSWHQSDVVLITWLRRHWVEVAIICTLIILGIMIGTWLLFLRLLPDHDSQHHSKHHVDDWLPSSHCSIRLKSGYDAESTNT